MIKGIGCDLVEIDRLKNKEEALASRILTTKEKEQYENYPVNRKIEYLAGRLAAKEAIFKAVGKGVIADFEILNNEYGKPVCHIEGYQLHLSISHEKSYAMAVAVLEERENESISND